MPGFIRSYVRIVDKICIFVGTVVTWSIFLLIGLLLYATISRTVFNHPLIWGVEVGEFIFIAYYFLAGAYVILIRGHVRVDVFYSKWKPRNRGRVDVVCDLFLIFYLVVMLIGGYFSTHYAIVYDQVKRSVWAPALWPIKVILMVGLILLLLQAFSTLFKDIAKARGQDLEQHLANLKIDEDV